MNRVLNYASITLMARTGFSASAIAMRHGCSAKQVRRILASEGIKPGKMRDFTEEKALWQYYRSFGESESKIALRFGVSRQAVNKYFTLIKNQKQVAIYGEDRISA